MSYWDTIVTTFLAWFTWNVLAPIVGFVVLIFVAYFVSVLVNRKSQPKQDP
jgi:uncharacterized membrane protein